LRVARLGGHVEIVERRRLRTRRTAGVESAHIFGSVVSEIIDEVVVGVWLVLTLPPGSCGGASDFLLIASRPSDHARHLAGGRLGPVREGHA
jgi:hypothetical protein